MTSPSRRTATDLALATTILVLFVAPYLWSPAMTSRQWPPAHYLGPDLLIAGLVWLRFREEAIRRLGLAIAGRDLLACLAILAGGLMITSGLMSAITADSQVQIAGHRPLFSASQVLHQELVLRGLLLGTLAGRRSSPVVLAAVAAIVFAAVHPLLFWWRWDLVLPATTGLTLFAFAWATNLLFLRTRHIGYSLAVHAAWNLPRFGTHYGRDALDRPITEWTSFAVIEGSPVALAASLALLAGVLLIQARTPRGAPPTARKEFPPSRPQERR